MNADPAHVRSTVKEALYVVDVIGTMYTPRDGCSAEESEGCAAVHEFLKDYKSNMKAIMLFCDRTQTEV